MPDNGNGDGSNQTKSVLDRRNVLLGGTTLAASAMTSGTPTRVAQAQQQPTTSSGKRQNILVIFGDDIGQSNIARTHSA